jgi:tetratricopeptide (TPR) repeat protein
MQRIATIRPGLVPAIARFCRHGALAAVVLSVTIGLMWFSWSFTDSYQFMQIRREAWSSVMEDPGGWALLAREVGAPMPEVDGSISARTLAFLASQDPDPGQRDRYRTLARSRAELDCDRAPHNCQEWIAEFSRAGLRSEGLAIAARLSPRCDKAIDFSSDDPLYTASRIIRICREAGNDAAALTAWNAAMSMHDASQDMRRRQFRDFLEQIPSDAPVPPPEFVFEGLRTDSPYRNERAGALFRGLARSGRVKEAIEYFQGLDAGDLSDSSYFFPKKPEQPVKYKLELLTQLEPVVRARFRGSTNEYALGQWLQVLSRELAGANDPEGALKLLPANGVDGDVVAAIADAFSRSGLFQRALETLQKLEAHVYGSTPLKEARGRACIEMARESQADVCMKMLKSLRGPDRTKVLALSGLALVKAGRHAAGVALLDTAEAHANGASGIARDEFEVVEVLAEAGRLRQARLISLKLLDREHRAAAYLSVCQRITGWSRSLGIFLSNWLGPLRPAK